MKKLLALIICFSFISIPAYSEIVDYFADNTLDKNLKIQIKSIESITDSFVENTLDKNITPVNYSYKPITDNFAENNKNRSNHSVKIVDFDEFIPKATNKKTIPKIVVIDNNSVTSVPVKIKKTFTTKSKVQEGDYLEFETKKDVVINNKTYPAGTTVKARIETISLNESWGVPSDLVLGNFSIDEIPIGGEINKIGANRTLWVRPIAWTLIILFWGAGILLTPIRGGHAKINPSETYILYAK